MGAHLGRVGPPPGPATGFSSTSVAGTCALCETQHLVQCHWAVNCVVIGLPNIGSPGDDNLYQSVWHEDREVQDVCLARIVWSSF